MGMGVPSKKPPCPRPLRGSAVTLYRARSADPTADEIRERDPVPPSPQAGGESECRRSDPERDDVGQRIQFAPKRRLHVPPAGDTAIEPVEEESRGRQGRGGEKEMGLRLAAHVAHAEEHCREPAGGVGQCQKVRQVKLADQREVSGRSGCHGGKIYAGSRQMSRMHKPCADSA